MVVTEGVTLAEVPVVAIGLQEYVLAPDAVKVELCPGQTEAGEAESDKVGNGLTVTLTTAEPVQPAVFPTTV